MDAFQLIYICSLGNYGEEGWKRDEVIREIRISKFQEKF